jgi:myosin heavy subunit
MSMVGDGANKQVEELYNNILKAHGKSDVFEKPKGMVPRNGPFKFKIIHSAKTVLYTSDAFIEKNSDSMSPSLEEFLQTQCDPIINKIYSMDVPGKKKDVKKTNDKSIWAKFRVQII